MKHNPLTKLDVTVGAATRQSWHWTVSVRNKIDSFHESYASAESRWAELCKRLPAWGGR